MIDNTIVGIVRTLDSGNDVESKEMNELFDIGDRVTITSVIHHKDETRVSILGFGSQCSYSSTFFDFEYNGKPYDIFEDELDLDDIIHDYIRF